MKKVVAFLWVLLVSLFAASAQEYKVESFEIHPNDLTARTESRIDLNGRKCGLIKIYVKDVITEAAGPVVGDIIDKGFEKRVYVSHDAKQIELYFKEHMPLRVTFDDFNFNTITGTMTYVMKLTDVSLDAQPQEPVQAVQLPTVAPQAPSGGNVETFTVNGVTFEMVKVEGGTFMMGSDSGLDREKPVHTETVGTFHIGKTEVTQRLWEAVMGSNPSKFRGKDRPVENVSWDDCQEFVERLSRLTGRQFRLPTEAEWEYAAKGGNKSRGFTYSGSNDIDRVACYYGNSGEKAHPVAQKLDNELGIYDMSGNVWEWCSDNWSANYSSPRNSSNRVNRGGSWYSYAAGCRVAIRRYDSTSYRNGNLGLRLAL